MLSLPKGLNEYYGKNVEQMPKLLSAGEVPMYVAMFMKRGLSNGEEFPDLCNNYFDSSDLVIYPKGDNKKIYTLLTVDNKGKITPNGRKALELIKEGNLASNRGAIVEQLTYLGRKDLMKVPREKITTETYLAQKQILNELIWRILARHPDEVPSEFAEDKNLLKEYSSEVQRRTKNSKNMALYIGNSLTGKTTLKAWCIDRLGGRSDAGGWYDLDGNGRLVGLAPEALSAPGGGEAVSKLEISIQTALRNKQAFVYSGTLYVPVQDKKVKLGK